MSVFKNVIVYRIEASWSPSLTGAEEALAEQRFVPCGPSQEKSAGWTEPRGQDHGPLVESVGGQWLLEFMIEAKTLPGSVVRRKVDERCAQIEATTGRKPGKKEKRDLKEDITHELLPMAFTRHARIAVWIDPNERRLVINASNAARADEVVTSLVKALEGFAVTQINTQIEPATAMSGWLSSQEPPAGFTIDRECELKATDESKSVVRYAKHALDIEEVRQHIADGKRPTRLAMTWEDRVSFELSETMQLRKIVFLEGTDGAQDGKKEDNFDADAAIATGELGEMVPALLEALGGEAAFTAAVAEPAQPAAGAATGASATTEADAEDAPF
ncbi:recombination-associated protein RdgC [Variovorax guangxiensis]|uniref:Recombination-associated protein RdgC n=1 Tax=Variovorax guangxiensis TaxID=1775474 RepID=A0A502DGF6_9BURK|nr:recombination-associated protein RdgC [Variovorax guangxiensis]RZI68829.1 MAG: recombination-associated protein RdgC [Variovorax sp.]TPG18928.1 recombination-associated protein RdgC [Variovorax ginsengisoli]TPG23760.1 recombination-associated protein RdgC [Variovorax guangxiensis]